MLHFESPANAYEPNARKWLNESKMNSSYLINFFGSLLRIALRGDLLRLDACSLWILRRRRTREREKDWEQEKTRTGHVPITRRVPHAYQAFRALWISHWLRFYLRLIASSRCFNSMLVSILISILVSILISMLVYHHVATLTLYQKSNTLRRMAIFVYHSNHLNHSTPLETVQWTVSNVDTPMESLHL